jgi:hypothetical protein
MQHRATVDGTGGRLYPLRRRRVRSCLQALAMNTTATNFETIFFVRSAAPFITP